MDRRLAISSLEPPPELGRDLVVRPGDSVPPAWRTADRRRLTPDLLEADRAGAVATDLARRALQRRPTVLECPPVVDLVLDQRSPLSVDRSPAALWAEVCDGGGLGIGVEELRHRVWSNAIDLRQPSSPRWGAVEAALAAGAHLASGVGDVVRADGSPIWIDAGPLRMTPPIAGVEVVPALVAHAVPDAGLGAGRREGDAAEHEPVRLAPDQLRVVNASDGNLRIIAPAGSGKTRVLADRVRHLLDEWSVPPAAATVVAFNRRARAELAHRLRHRPGVRVSTLNALGLAVLDDGRRPRRTLPAAEFARLVAGLLDDTPLGDRPIDAEHLGRALDGIRRVRLGLEPPETIDPHLARLIRRVDATLERRRRIDFDGQIDAAIRLLLADPAVRHRHQAACRVLVVDEFQDLTPAHLMLIGLLAGRGGALVAVGDDDQTIYGYQGAWPDSLVDVDRFVPGSSLHRLEVNYRCPPDVVEAADALLTHNVDRLAKTIRPAPGRKRTAALEVHRVDDPLACTVDRVAAAIDEGWAPSEIAVLARVNVRLAPVAGALGRRSIPVGRLDRRCRSTILPDVLEWWRRTVGDVPVDEPSLLAGAPADGDIEHLRGLIAVGGGFGRWFDALVGDIGLAGATVDEIAAVTDVVRYLDHQDLPIGQWAHELGRSLGEVPAVAPDGVVLSTIHRVKGLEWPVVIMHGVDRHHYPHHLSGDIEAERRIFHVGITRARHRLVLVTGREPSPFIAELSVAEGGRSGSAGTVTT